MASFYPAIAAPQITGKIGFVYMTGDLAINPKSIMVELKLHSVLGGHSMRRGQLLTGLLWGLTAAFIAGCTGYRINDEYNVNPAHLSPEALANVPNHRLCEAYSRNSSPALRAELKRRGTFNELEWRAIEERKVLIGISEMALITALPGIKCTSTLRSNGVVTKEWYFARLTDVEVCTENGIVVWLR